ncbi:MAG TPA: radical SAM family heme chaperone HemW [Puia sp.]|nr:radical SAM family heme chaperone HemW [Puia sp.]
MAGIYLHIPFCRQACHYCNFHFSTSMKGKNDFIPALLKEMEARTDYIAGESVSTIYFGGGTPSLLEPDQLDTIVRRLSVLFQLESQAEITLEANPDDITPDRLAAWKRSGINRLSIGVQSFFEADLRWMNRAHDARQALDCIGLAQRAGFQNLSIDLIYGGPTLPDSHWKQNVDQALSLGIPHLSCYALTVEPRTALDHLIRTNQVHDVDPGDQARQFLLLMDWAAAARYEQYEISNFALPGHRSRHNASYWQGCSYLGLGPSAHSFNGRSRQWNVANNAAYIAAIIDGRGTAVAEREELTPVQQLNEYIMISLRTVEGSSYRAIAQRFGPGPAEQLWRRAERYMTTGKIRTSADVLQLTNEGKLLADGIAADLFFD